MAETWSPVVLTNDTGQKLNASYFNRVETGIDQIDVRVAALELGITLPGAVGDGVADDTSAVTAALAALPTGATADLGGRIYKITAPLTLTKAVQLRNGTINAGAHNALRINASGVLLGPNLTLTRSTSAAVADSLSARALVAATAPFVSNEVVYSGTNHACVYLGHAQCDGTRITGGSMTNNTARQNSAGVYVAAGATGNYDITIRDVTVTGTCSDGIIFFDAGRCKVVGNKVSGMTRLATVTTSGWVLQSGNVYRSRSAAGTPGSTGVSTDREDGSTRVVTAAGTQLTENTASPTTPGSNEWGISGGFLYINLGGTNPGTVTVLSDIVSGYGVTMYSTSGGFQDMSHNLVAHNTIREVDGFGIYMQLSSYAGAEHNTTMGNALRNVCKTGSQHDALPFAGIAWNGGLRCLSVGDQIDAPGSSGTPAPGFFVSDASQTCRGMAVGVTVSGGSAEGFRVNATSDWTYNGCIADSNTTSGFRGVLLAAGSPKRGIEITNCKASNNTIRGVDLDGSAGLMSATITGGMFHNNAQQGVQLTNMKNTFVNGSTFHDNGVTSFHQLRFFGDCVESGFNDVTMYHLLAGQSISLAASQTSAVHWGSAVIKSNMVAPAVNSNQTRTVGGPGTAAEYAGSGVPTIAGVLGDRYWRTDTPSTTNQRLYVCTTAGAAGAAVWTAVL